MKKIKDILVILILVVSAIVFWYSSEGFSFEIPIEVVVGFNGIENKTDSFNEVLASSVESFVSDEQNRRTYKAPYLAVRYNVSVSNRIQLLDYINSENQTPKAKPTELEVRCAQGDESEIILPFDEAKSVSKYISLNNLKESFQNCDYDQIHFPSPPGIPFEIKGSLNIKGERNLLSVLLAYLLIFIPGVAVIFRSTKEFVLIVRKKEKYFTD